MPTFKEWLREKTEESRQNGWAQRRNEWIDAYQRLTNQILDWLREDGAEYINIGKHPVERAEQGVGTYELPGFKIRVGDAAVDIVPIGRNVIGHIGPEGLTGPRAAGRVDIRDGSGARKYALYRAVQDDQDVWYVVDERGSVTPLNKERLQEIIMDLMS